MAKLSKCKKLPKKQCINFDFHNISKMGTVFHLPKSRKLNVTVNSIFCESKKTRMHLL